MLTDLCQIARNNEDFSVAEVLGGNVETAMIDQPEWVGQLVARLDKLETLLKDLKHQRSPRDWYSTEEVAQILGKAKFTVREWCRHGRVQCRKQGSGRGKYQSWVIAHEELLRIQREGLLPMTAITSTIQ
jgi:hypothetical protein